MTENTDLARTRVESALHDLAPRLGRARRIRHGDIVFRLSGPSGTSDSVLTADRDGVRVVPADDVVPANGRTRKPLVEVLGDPEAVRAVLAGEVEGRERFLAGGIRVRGDLRYLSDLALELGLLAKPL
jgi:hypothetical protein